MTRLIFLIAILLTAGPFVQSRDIAVADTPEKSSDVQTQWKKLSAEFSIARDKLETEHKTASKRRQTEIRKKLRTLTHEYAPRMLDCAKDNLDDKNAFEPLFWIAISVKEGPHINEALILLKEHFANASDNLNLWMMLPELVDTRSNEVNPFLRRVLQKNPQDRFRGSACFYLAVRLKRQAERTGDHTLSDESERLLRRAIKEFPKTRCRGGLVSEQAKRELKNLQGPLGIGHTAPDTEGEDLDGVNFNLADYRGKVVLLSFCGQWCGPCRKMYPHEQTLVEKLANKPFVFIEVNSDRDRIAHRKFMKKKNYTWRCFWDGRQGPITAAWEIQASPTYYVLDRKGIIRYKAIGSVDDATLQHWTNTLINEPPTSQNEHKAIQQN